MSVSSLLLLLLLLLQLSCFLPQLSRTLGSLNDITALVLSETFDEPESVNSALLPVEVSSPLLDAEHNIDQYFRQFYDYSKLKDDKPNDCYE